MQKLFESKYGYFDKNGEEYVITDPQTPKPWVNVISNGDYSIIVSQNGSGYSFRSNAGENRITRSYQDLVKDNWGKYYYIRDLEDGEFWSVGRKPVMHAFDFYEVRHGIGYTRILQRVKGIETEVLFFVVPNYPVEMARIRVKNTGNVSRKLDITSYTEWVLGSFPDEHREFHKIFVDSKFDKNAILAEKLICAFPDEKGRHNNRSWDQTAFHAVSESVKSYDGDKESFIGMYRDESKPQSMENDLLGKKTGRFTDPIAALQVEVNLKPGEEKEVLFTTGTAYKGKEDPVELIEKFTSVQACEREFKNLSVFWSEFLDCKIETPDKAMDIMTNIWLKYQAISGRIWAKSGYYQVSGGYGFRDQLQDSLIFLTCKPEMTKKQLLMHAAHQFREGDVLHWWLTIGNWGPRTKCSDDLLWLVFIAYYYIQETNDYSILDETVPYYDGGQDTFYIHCKKAVEKVMSRFSPRGVPLMGDNDWNDGLSAVGTDWKGESFWMSEFFYMVLGQFMDFGSYAKDSVFLKKAEDVMQTLKESFEKYGWDGKWYLQATTDGFEKIGSNENEEGKIFLNPQLWSLISSIGDSQRAVTAMENVTEYLLRDYGALLLAPAYTAPRTDIGYITRYAPGLRENGGVYTHAATWAVWAYSLLKEGNLAYEAYKRICPPNRCSDIDLYSAEPYVTAGNSDGPLSPYFGRGGWSWYTGSAQWLERVALNHILGIQSRTDGLLVEPCLPEGWDGFSCTRKFRNACYIIEVSNPKKVSTGIKEVYIDGAVYGSNLLPVFNDGKDHHVRVVMG